MINQGLDLGDEDLLLLIYFGDLGFLGLYYAIPSLDLALHRFLLLLRVIDDATGGIDVAPNS